MRTFKIRGACTAKLPNKFHLFALLVFLLCISFPVSAATQRITIGNLVYTIDDETKEAEVYGSAVSSIRNLVIPDEITYNEEVYPVTSIRQYAFSQNNGLTGSLTIGDNVTTIGYGAFSYCRGFTGSLTIGDNVATIEDGAFQYCSGFTGSLTIGDNVTSIGDWAFQGCSGFTGSLTIGDNVTSIGFGAFYGCSGFTGSLVIPNNVTSIGQSAFRECSGFNASLTLGENLKTLESAVFWKCSGLTGKLRIPESVEKISNQVFIDCSFTELEIGSNVKEIMTQAFVMETLKSVTCSTVIPPLISKLAREVFMSNTYNNPLYVPAESVDRYKTANEWEKFRFINPITPEITGISFEKANLSLSVGETVKLNVIADPTDANISTLVWTSQNPDIAIVEDGVVKGLKPGTVTITVETENGLSASCEVTVIQPADGITIDFGASGIEGNDLTLNVGESKTIVAVVTPAGSTDKFIWASSDPAVATVDENGKVTAVKPGETIVTVTTESGKSASLKVTVLQPADGITIDFGAIGIEGNDLTLNVGESKTISVVVTPAGSTDKLTWTSSDPAVATVDGNGKVTAVKPGETTVTVTTESGKSASLKVTVLQPADGITIDFGASSIEGDNLTLNVGESKTIVAVVTPAGSTDKLTWTSSDPAVATVDENGKVTAVKPGEITVTVTTESGKSASLKVTVLQPADGITIDFGASGIDGTDLTLNVGESKTIVAVVTPAGSTDKLTWTSSDPAVATVDENGKVTAVKPGEATVTFTTESDKSASLKVTVLQPADGITIDVEDLTLNVGESKTIVAVITPAGSTDKLTWTSSDPAVATVDENGKVTALKAGETTVTVTTESGKSASLKVTVLQPADGITIDFGASGIEGNDLTLNVGESRTIVAVVTPAGSTDKLTWTSSDPAVAIVDENGKITAVKPGETTVTVTTESGKSASLKVTVLQPADSINIDFGASGIEGNDLTLNVGESKTIVAVVTPAGSTDKLTWISSDPAVATVDENGKVTAVKPGETTITVTTESGKSASLKVTVLQPAEGVTIDFSASGIEGDNLTLNVGESKTIVVVVTPAGSTDKLIWTSSDPAVATVDENGKITAIKPGETTVTVTTESGKSASLKVTVLQPADGITIDFGASGIEGNDLTLNVGESRTIVAVVTPAGSTDKLIWTSSDPAVAIVDENGKITAVKPGETTVTVTTESGKSASLKVTVLQPADGITIDFGASGIEGNDLTLNVGESKTIVAVVTPAGSTDKLTWTSSDPAVATVDENGKVTAVNPGETTVTVTTESGKSASLKVTVLQPADGITIDFGASGIEGNDLTLNVGESKTISVVMTPAGSTDKLTWTSSDPAVATVDENGKVTAFKAGETTVTVTTESGKSASLKVTVIQLVEGIKIDLSAMGVSGDNLEMYKGESKTIIVTFIPENATDKTLTFSSADAAIAVVDAEGVITANALGSTVITVTAADGASATLTVSVIPTPAESISLNLLEATLKIGENVQLEASILPDDATDKSVTWTTENVAIATVDANGMVTAKSLGTTIVTATTINGLTAECRIVVARREVPQPVATPCGTEYDTLNGAVLDLFVTVSGGDENGWSYAWSDGSMNLGNTSSIKFEAINPGTKMISENVSVLVRNTVDGEIIFENTFNIKVNVWATPEIADENGGINVVAPGIGAGTANAGVAKVREGDRLTLSVEPGVGGYDNGWSYLWTIGGTKIGDGEMISTRAAMSSGSQKGTEPAIYSVNVKNVGPDGELWAEADLSAQVEVYRRPLTPKALLRKGDGTTHTLICMIDVENEQLAPLGYTFVYGYDSANGEEKVLAETAKRYCRAPEAAFKDNSNRFWIYSVWNYGDGVVVTSGKRYMDGSVDEDFSASVFDASVSTVGCTIDYTDSANWIKTNGKSVVVAIDSEYDTEIGIYATDGRCMRRMNIPAGTSMRQDIDVNDLNPGAYIITVRSGEEVSTKKFIIK